MSRYRPKPSAFAPQSAGTLMQTIDALAPFISALTEHYGAVEVPAKPHRCFTNPWAMTEGNPFIFIRASDARVSYGESISKSMRMSDRLMQSIARREQRIPVKPTPEAQHPGPCGRDPKI